MSKQRALNLGTTAAIVIVGGFIVAILLSQTAATFDEGRARNTTGVDTETSVPAVSGKVWIIGLVYIIPGVIGLAAAYVQNKCMYIATCIFAIISLLIMGLVAIISSMALLHLVFSQGIVSERCIDTDDRCRCRSDKRSYMDEYTPTHFKTCAYFEKFNSLATALFAFVVLAWSAEIMEFVFACYYTCRSKATPGVVIMASQQPMLQPGPDAVPQGYGQGYPPPAYDQGCGQVYGQGYGQGYPFPEKV